MHRTNKSCFTSLMSLPLLVSLSLALAVSSLSACGGGGTGTAPVPAPAPAPQYVQYSSQAGSATGTLSSPPTTTGNSIGITIDTGPAASPGQVNKPYVSVTVCTPGATTATTACQTIDHVLLDTGSTGLRLFHSVLYSTLMLPAATNGFVAYGECQPFMIGTTWGSVRNADIYLGGEVARSVAIQDIGDAPGGYSSIPTYCLGYGNMLSTPVQYGANGILGVGVFKNDCATCTAVAGPGAYYACTSSGCSASTVTASQIVQNPVANFSQDNNGMLVNIASIGSTGSASGSVAGTATFGINTQSDNQLNGATVYTADTSGNMNTTFNGSTLTSFLDTGSNALFFDDSSIPVCTTINTWLYCPASSPLQLSATNSGANNLPQPGTSTPFSIISGGAVPVGTVAANIGGPYPGLFMSFDWGLPFFFGRQVAVAIGGTNVTIAGVPTPGPFFAY